MIKNGVTPDVITFVDATNQDINEEVLVAIQSEHDIDQSRHQRGGPGRHPER